MTSSDRIDSNTKYASTPRYPAITAQLAIRHPSAAPSNPVVTVCTATTTLIAMTTVAVVPLTTFVSLELTNPNPTTAGLAVRKSSGMIANGSWTLCKMLSHWFMRSSDVAVPDPSSSNISATATVGTNATALVTSARCNVPIFKFRKPDITNCPAYVPVIVELIPAANSPSAHTIPIAPPNRALKNVPALYNPISGGSSRSPPSPNPWANTPMTATLITSVTTSAMPASTL